MCFLDASKAFDRVKHSIHLYYNSLSLCDVLSLDILLDYYAICMTGRLCVSDGAIHSLTPFMQITACVRRVFYRLICSTCILMT